MAFSIETLIAARFVQAVGGSGASVLARAVVRDMYEGTRIGRELARMAAIMALAPLVAPLIGGVLETAFGWRSNFVVLFLLRRGRLDHGVVPAAGDGAPARAGAGVDRLDLALLSPFSRRQELRHPSRHRDLLPVRIVRLDFQRGLRPAGHLWSVALAFGLAFAIGSSGYMVGTTIAARFVMRWGSGRTMGFGTAAMALGGLVMVCCWPSRRMAHAA